jgi:L-rhamnose mutarotase
MPHTIRYCRALDLIDDAEKIQTYIAHHERIWPEIAANIRASGIVDMQIWRLETRLFMIMEVSPDFSPERAAAIAAAEPKVAEWETLMWQFQTGTPWTPAGEKWLSMDKIFDLSSQP